MLRFLKKESSPLTALYALTFSLVTFAYGFVAYVSGNTTKKTLALLGYGREVWSIIDTVAPVFTKASPETLSVIGFTLLILGIFTIKWLARGIIPLGFLASLPFFAISAYVFLQGLFQFVPAVDFTAYIESKNTNAFFISFVYFAIGVLGVGIGILGSALNSIFGDSNAAKLERLTAIANDALKQKNEEIETLKKELNKTPVPPITPQAAPFPAFPPFPMPPLYHQPPTQPIVIVISTSSNTPPPHVTVHNELGHTSFSAESNSRSRPKKQ